MKLYLTDEHMLEAEPIIWYDDGGYGYCMVGNTKIRYTASNPDDSPQFDPFHIGFLSNKVEQCQVCDEPKANLPNGGHHCWHLSVLQRCADSGMA